MGLFGPDKEKTLSKGYTAYLNGDYKKSIHYLNKILEHYPNFDIAWFHKGNALYNLGKFQEAVECYDKVISSTDPSMVNFRSQAAENKTKILKEFKNEEFLAKKAKFTSSKNYNYLKGFMDRFGKQYSRNDLKKLKNLLSIKGFEFTSDELELLIKDLHQKNRYNKFKPKMLDNISVNNTMNSTSENYLKVYVEKFLEIYGNNYLNHLDLFWIFLEEYNIKFYKSEVNDIIYEVRKKKELSSFEKEIIILEKNCPKCNNNINKNAKFCPECGENLNLLEENSEDHLLDVNTASEDKIASLPGIGPILAKRAIKIRESKGGFKSVDNFCSLLELKPHVSKNMESLITVKLTEKIKKPRENEPSARIVDF